MHVRRKSERQKAVFFLCVCVCVFQRNNLRIVIIYVKKGVYSSRDLIFETYWIYVFVADKMHILYGYVERK